MSFKLLRRGEQSPMNGKRRIHEHHHSATGLPQLPLILENLVGSSPNKPVRRLGQSPTKNIFRRELTSPSKDAFKREMRASPTKEGFRRELNKTDFPLPPRRGSIDSNMTTTAIPKRSSIKSSTTLEEKNDERGFLDRAFESAFTFDVDEP